jgi:hypothetical protein
MDCRSYGRGVKLSLLLPRCFHRGLALALGLFSSPLFTCKNEPFLSRGGGTRTHTVRILSPILNVYPCSWLFDKPQK